MNDHPEVATTRRLIANILTTVDQGLTEAGMPLTSEQREFFKQASA